MKQDFDIKTKIFCFIILVKRFLSGTEINMWRGSYKALDLLPIGRTVAGSSPGRFAARNDKLFTHICASVTKQDDLVLFKRR